MERRMTMSCEDMLMKYRENPKGYKPEHAILELFDKFDTDNADEQVMARVVYEICANCSHSIDFNSEFGVLIVWKMFEWYLKAFVEERDKEASEKAFGRLCVYTALRDAWWVMFVPDEQREIVGACMDAFENVRSEAWGEIIK